MQAIEFVKDGDSWEPDAETCQAVIQEALKMVFCLQEPAYIRIS